MNIINPFQWLRRFAAMKMSSFKRLPILHRLVSKSNNNLVRISILLTKMKKPMIHKLIFLKKSRKLKKFKLLKHYNYGFLGEYQFDSPSSTPLIRYCNTKHELENKRIQDIYSILFLRNCFGCLKTDDQARGEADCRLALELADNPMALALEGEIDLEADEEDDDSVDERAQRFIENFYAEMRLQRQESF